MKEKRNIELIPEDDVMSRGRLRHEERKIKDVRMDFIDRKYRY